MILILAVVLMFTSGQSTSTLIDKCNANHLIDVKGSQDEIISLQQGSLN